MLCLEDLLGEFRDGKLNVFVHSARLRPITVSAGVANGNNFVENERKNNNNRRRRRRFSIRWKNIIDGGRGTRGDRVTRLNERVSGSVGARERMRPCSGGRRAYGSPLTPLPPRPPPTPTTNREDVRRLVATRFFFSRPCAARSRLPDDGGALRSPRSTRRKEYKFIITVRTRSRILFYRSDFYYPERVFNLYGTSSSRSFSYR